MAKKYYIKQKDYEMAELCMYNTKDKLNNLEYDWFFKDLQKENNQCVNMSEGEYNEQIKFYEDCINELEDAMNNVSFQGYQPLAEWKYVEIIKKWAKYKQASLNKI